MKTRLAYDTPALRRRGACSSVSLLKMNIITKEQKVGVQEIDSIVTGNW